MGGVGLMLRMRLKDETASFTLGMNEGRG